MGGANGARRSSAAGLSHRPPLPPNINNRSHSLDVLDTTDKSSNDDDNAQSKTSKHLKNSNKNKSEHPSPPELTQNKESTVKASNRRSRSLDDLLDDTENSLICVEEDDHTRSMENMPELPCEHEVITVNNSMQMSDQENSVNDDSGIQCCSFDESAENADNEDSRSNSVSIASSDLKDERKPKTFLNKYVKKVKSFIKK